MATVAELLVKVGADTSGLRKEIAATKRQLKTAFGSDALNLSNMALKGIGALGASLAGLGAYAVKAGGELQNVQVAMKNLLGSADAAESFINKLQGFAARTPFEFNDVVQASQKFLAFGFTVDQIIPTLTAVGDAAAGVGAGQDGVNRLTIALGQIAAKGKLASQEMMQMTELGIPAWKMLADALKTDVAGAQDMVTKGMVDSQTALEAIVSGMSQNYGGMMSQQSTTILGTWSNLMDGIGQTVSQVGLQIADSLNLTSIFSGIGDFLADFAAQVKESGITGALASIIPPEVILAITAFGTALGAVAMPAIVTAGGAAVAAIAPFVAILGAAVTAAAPFIAGIAAVSAACYMLYDSGISVTNVLDLMGLEVGTFTGLWDRAKSVLSTFGKMIESVIRALSPLFGVISTVFVAGVSIAAKGVGALINVFVSIVDTVLSISQSIMDAMTSLANFISDTFNYIAGILGSVADAVLPDWANKSLGTISDFVGKASSWLNGLISKIVETNDALSATGKTDQKQDKPKWQMPNFANFAGKKADAISAGAGTGKTPTGDNLVTEAQNTSKSIADEWARTFSTKSELVDRWYNEELAQLEKSASANENYERDKQRLSELYSAKRIEALQEESRQQMDLYKQILSASTESKTANVSVNGSAADADLLEMQNQHQSTIASIEARWQSLSDTFIGLTQTQKDAFIKALEEQQIAFEQTEAGELDFHKQILQDKLVADQTYEDARLNYYTQCKDIKAGLDQAYNDLDMARLQETLTEEAAVRLNDMEAQKTMMDTYQEAYLAAHQTTAQLMSELYSTAFTGLSDTFTAILTGAQSAKQAFENLGRSMLQVIAQYYAKQAAGLMISYITGKKIKDKEAAESATKAAASLSQWAPVAVAYETVHPGSAAMALANVTSVLGSAAALGGTLIAAMTGGAKGAGSGDALKMPGYASGGYFTKPSLGIIGEGQDPEVALPLNRAVFENIAAGIASAGSTANNTVTQNIYGNINNAADVDDLFNGLSAMVASGLRGV